MRRFLPILVAMVLALSACGSGDDDAAETPDTAATSETTVASDDVELATGVDEDSIKIAVSLIDFDCIADFVDEVRIDQEETYQAFIDEVNDTGGVNGRMIEAVFKTHCPIPGQEPSSLTTCTSATEDDEVFAIIGIFIDFAGEAHACVTRDHNTVLITHGLTQPFIDDAPSGLLLTPDITNERRLKVILSLLRSEQLLDGLKVAVLAEANSEERIADAVEPELDQMDVERGTDAILAITDTDTTQAQTQLDTAIEKWKSEGVEAVILLGATTSSKQFVEKIKAELPDAHLVADTTSILSAGRDYVDAGTEPNPYEGMYTAEGETGEQHMQGDEGKRCHEIWERHTGNTAPGPNDIIDGPDGKRIATYAAIGDACVEVTMFVDIATAVGPALNIDNWRATVDAMGSMRIASTLYASLGPGKYDADDTYRLVAFDSSIPENGDWREVTPVQDVADL